MDKSDGGPVFPMPGQCVDEKWEPIPGFTGMTLRDYFAAKALPLCIAEWKEFRNSSENDHFSREWNDEHTMELIAEDAFNMADAMLRAREST